MTEDFSTCLPEGKYFALSKLSLLGENTTGCVEKNGSELTLQLGNFAYILADVLKSEGLIVVTVKALGEQKWVDLEVLTQVEKGFIATYEVKYNSNFKGVLEVYSESKLEFR